MLDQTRELQEIGRDVMGWMPRLLIAVVIVLGSVLGGLTVRRVLLRLSADCTADVPVQQNFVTKCINVPKQGAIPALSWRAC